MKKSLLFSLLLLVSSLTFSQETNAIFTDRPNATDAAGLINEGDFQVELGFLSDTDNNKNVTTLSITQPNISVKYGLFEWMELRVLTNYQLQVRDDGTTETRNSGITPVTFSPKFRIIDQEGFLSKLSATASLTLPNAAAKAFQNNKLNFGYRILMENTLSDRLSWSHGLGTDFDDNVNANWVYSSALGIAITDKFSAFTEVYGNINTNANTYYWDGGLSYLILNNLSADAMVGAGLNKAASDYFLSLGLAWKTNFKN